MTTISDIFRHEWVYDHDWIQQYTVESGADGSPTEQLWQQIDVLFYRDQEGDLDPTDPCSGTDTGTKRPVNIRCVKLRIDATTTIGWGYRYDANGQLARVVPPPPGLTGTSDDGLEVVYTYYAPGDISPGASPGMLKSIHLEVDDNEGGTTTLANGQWAILYDAASRIGEVRDARDKSTFYQWDEASRLTRVENAEGDVTIYEYGSPTTFDGAGTLLRRILRGDATSQDERTVLVYDARGNLSEIKRWDGTAYVTYAEYAYDSDDNRESFRDARFVAASGTDGLEYSYTWDGLGRLSDILDNATVPGPNGNHTQLEYDYADRIAKIIDARGATTDFSYDYMGRLTRAVQHGMAGEFTTPLTTIFNYDPLGNVTEVQDPRQVGVVDPNDPTRELATRYAWDGLSRLTAVEQPLGETVTYEYDARSQLGRITTARDRKLEFTYAPWGGLLQRNDYPTSAATTPNRIIRYAYDAAANLRSVADDAIADTYGNSTTSTELLANRLYSFEYDDANRIQRVVPHYIPGYPTASMPDIELVSGYDHRGIRTSLDFTTEANTYNLAWAYDPQGRLDALTTSGVGSQKVVDFDWLPNDALEKITHANSAVTVLSYHDHGPLKDVTVTGASELLKVAYTPDAVLNVDQIGESWNGQASPIYEFDYGYDGLQRLTSADYPDTAQPGLFPGLSTGTDPFAYDTAGNRDDPTATPPPDDWASNENNQLTKSPGTPLLCYDADGNLEKKVSMGDCAAGTATETFTFDATNRLTGYTGPGGSSSYVYDPFGRRIAKTVTSGTTYYLWDGDVLLGEYSELGQLQVRYAYGEGFAPVQVAYGGPAAEAVYAVHSDHLDTPRMLTDGSGNVVWRAAYEAYGAAHLDEDPDGDLNQVAFNIRFPGQYFDEETGLHYNRHRYYDPSIGRYISADPIGQAGGVNLYRYALNSPTRYFDPDGRDAREKLEALLSAGPIDSARAGYSIKNQAFDMARRSGLPGASGGQQDAFRHCVWQCETTKQTNAEDAKDIGDAHERAGDRAGQSPSDRAMDDRNNEEGRDCGLNDPRGCAVSCMDKLSKGKLAGPGGAPMPAPPTTPTPPTNPGPVYY